MRYVTLEESSLRHTEQLKYVNMLCLSLLFLSVYQASSGSPHWDSIITYSLTHMEAGLAPAIMEDSQ